MHKQEAKVFLERISIHILRNVARLIEVARPTTMAKAKLVDSIIGILNGELEPDNKNHRYRTIKMGVGLYNRCESVLAELQSILNINDSLICKIKPSQRIASIFETTAPHAYNQHVNYILSLSEEQTDLEIIARFVYELSTAKERQLAERTGY